MAYKGRFVSVIFVMIILLTIRTAVKLHFGSVPHQTPFLAITLVLIGWFLGKEYDKSTYKANRDSLTGLFNRHYVLENSQKVFSRAKRRKQEVGIILIDVNDFKDINDNFGHEAGDLVLQHISGLLTDCFDSDDIVSRWGGDEFLIISPDISQEGLAKKINNLETSVENKDWKYQNVSLSIGQAVYPLDADNFDQLVSQADSRMYDFKIRHNKSTSSEND